MSSTCAALRSDYCLAWHYAAMHAHTRMLQPHYWLAGDHNKALGLYWCVLSDRFCILLLSCYCLVVRTHTIVSLVQQQNNFVVRHCKAHWAVPGAITACDRTKRQATATGAQ